MKKILTFLYDIHNPFRIRKRLILFFAVMGPGVIAAIADNDAGGVATYSLLASKFGYSMLFLLLLITVLLGITQEIGARITLVTCKGLGDLIREFFGIRISMVVFLCLLIANTGTTIANFAGLTAGFKLFHLPVLPFLFLFIVLMILFVSKGNYHTNQRIFLTGALLYVAYIFSALLAKPDWNKALTSLIIPQDVEFSFEYVLGAIALLGTTITPWGQFFISSFVNDKKLTIDSFTFTRLEVYFGAFLTDFFSFFIIVSVAATLFINKIVIQSASDAALAIKPFAGDFAAALFGVGLLNASFMGAVIVPLTTAYAFSEFFGYEGSLDTPLHKGRLFYWIFIIQIVIAGLIVLMPRVSLFKIVLYTQSLNGVLLPLIMYFLVKLVNNREIMGRYVNGPITNIIMYVSMSMIVIASFFVIIGGFFGLI